LNFISLPFPATPQIIPSNRSKPYGFAIKDEYTASVRLSRNARTRRSLSLGCIGANRTKAASLLFLYFSFPLSERRGFLHVEAKEIPAAHQKDAFFLVRW
jgi:hypothetical protein